MFFETAYFLIHLNFKVYDDDPDSRLRKTTKAISQITTILPFRKQTKILISENEFLKYLLLNLPILKGNSIIMIIESLVYNFYQEDVFQRNFGAAVEYIAKIKDFFGPDSPLSEVSPKESHFRASMLRQDFCLEISMNKIYLKESTLRHFKQFINHFLEQESAKTEQTIRKEIIEILKSFLKNTYSELIITKVSSLLETLRSHWKEYWLNGTLDLEIEESKILKCFGNYQFFLVIISKSSIYLKQNEDLVLTDEASNKNDNNSNFEDLPSKSNLENSLDESMKKKENEEDDEFAKVFDPLMEVEEWLIAGFSLFFENTMILVFLNRKRCACYQQEQLYFGFL